jgi:tRNA (cytidine32/uridine32-2'-O)-methyltransferase
MLALARVRVVLLRPEHPGNIGSVARAMANMGLSDLCLVAPREFPSPVAKAMAAGADHILARAEVVASLDEALAQCSWVVGATARARVNQVEQRAPEQAMAELLHPRHARVAMLFGPEGSGLDNDALERCQRVTRIPVDAAFSSLNLAAAVTVLCYELRRQAAVLHEAPGDLPVPPAQRPATGEELRHLIDHVREAVEQGGEDPERAAAAMKKLTRLLNRAAPEHGEVQLLRGLLKEAMDRPRRL